MNELANIELITEDKIKSYLNALGLTTQLNPNEATQFIEMALASQLNPFKREIYCIAFGKDEFRKLSIITGYEVYLKRAERSGKLTGWDADIEGSGESMYAKVTIHRKDWTQPFVHKAYWDECKQMTYNKESKTWKLNSMWAKMGRFMLKKVAIAQAFRLCFPDELGGMPYTADEPLESITVSPYEELNEISSDGQILIPDNITPNVLMNNDEITIDPLSPHILIEGDVIEGKWYWNLKAEQKAQYMPAGCSHVKVDGRWICSKIQ